MMDLQEKNPITQQIKKIAEAHSSSPFFSDFLSFFLSQVSDEDLAQYSSDRWVKLSSEAFEFYRSSGPGLASPVGIYNMVSDSEGKAASSAVIHIVHPHLPFLVDSLYTALTAERHPIGLFLHLILKPSREEGCLVGLEQGKAVIGEKGLESFLHIHLENPLSQEQTASLQHIFESVLQDVTLAVADWKSMRERAEHCVKELESRPSITTDHKEQSAFLKWLESGFFTFLGYRFYTGASSQETLGVCKTQLGSFFGSDEHTEKNILMQTWGVSPYFSVTKTMIQSRVHRPVPMDVVRLTSFDKEGAIQGEHQFFGLFTAAVYNAPLQDIPFIRTKVSQVLEVCQVQPDWYDGRGLMYILESLPRDLLFQTSVADLAQLSQTVLRLKERHKLSLFVLPDPLGHFVSHLVYIPRDRYTAALALDMGAMLADCYKGVLISHETHIGGDLSFARVHYLISTDAHPQHRIVCDIHSTEMALSELSLSWEERLTKEYRERADNKTGLDVRGLFSSAYQERFTVRDALKDLPFIEKSLNTSAKVIRVYENKAENPEIHVKIFSPAQSLFLSDVFPILENMGLRVLTEASYKAGEGSNTVWIHHFISEPLQVNAEPFEKIYENFLSVLEKVLRKQVEDDSFNRLVLAANLSDRQILLVRAYYRYMRQLAWPFLRPAIVPVLERYPHVLKKLGKLFYLQFSPDESFGDEESLLKEINTDLGSIENGKDENILSGFLTLIRATQRTNFFQLDETSNFKEYVSLKFAPALIEPLDDTKPLYEVFVYAPWVEAIHLRSGKVARGGIRWSDRGSDYRKEVLELMKAQLVKNAVIVPMGSKGGFYVRTPVDHLSFGERQEVGIHAYKTLVRGLLDITDNWIGGKIIPPKGVKRRDEDDSYLVVAADKGTATFSDIANGLSKDYGFWLGDAFASGGSAGYDHKKMGITSRGAWESVKRHFREMGKNIEAPFTVVGVGDMSGDVFGNGMLLSNQIKLVAAFNHAHIFIDPTPDITISYQERKRLFELPRSQWSDYNSALLSKGGGVYERKSKSIKLSSEAQKMLGLSIDEIKPDHLIEHILKLSVDLLWFGGIGTYVKSATETDGDVGDKANDAVRINGEDMKARVVGEGANLALTQKGRMAYALKGGKINRDSVDNSAGVDCSDHEVNIKILFQSILKSGQLDEAGRNALLKEMTTEVGQLVVRHNYMQTQAISMIESRGYKALARQNRLIRFFESQERLSREQEALPSEEQVEQRIEKQVGLTRPEIAVLVSHAKLYLYEKILESDLPESQELQPYLMAYFPQPLQKKYPSFIEQHPLKRELIATSEANFLVNRLGTTFLFEFERRFEKSLVELIKLFTLLRQAFGLESYWRRIESLDGVVPYQVQMELFSLLVSLSEKMMEWILKGGHLPSGNGPVEIFWTIPVKVSISEKELEKLKCSLVGLEAELASVAQFEKVLTLLKEIL